MSDSDTCRHFSTFASPPRILVMSGVIRVRNLNTHINSIGLITASVIVLVIGFMSMPMAFGDGRCSTLAFINDANVYPRCIIVDTEPPKIAKAFVTPSDYVCVETHDNTQTVKVTFNGKQVPKWSGSNGFFCAKEVSAAIRIIAEDIVGNKSEMLAINKQLVLEREGEQVFAAERSVALNPHHGVEGIVLSAKVPIKQIRLAKSPELTDRHLWMSEKAFKELDGEKLVEIKWKGIYADQLYGKETYGQIYVFATNKGKLATFDVVVKDDIVVYQHHEKKTHKPYNLDLKNASTIQGMDLNAWQKAELEKTFTDNGELTIVQKNILMKFLT